MNARDVWYRAAVLILLLTIAVSVAKTNGQFFLALGAFVVGVIALRQVKG